MNKVLTPAEVEEFLFDKIPISKALCVRVVRSDESGTEIAAQLAPNLNHLGTAFGGSLNSVLVLACYSYLFNVLASRGFPGHVVLKKIEIKYAKPVVRDFSAVCPAPAAADLERFFKTLKRKGRAQIELTAAVSEGGVPACEFTGIFVAGPE